MIRYIVTRDSECRRGLRMADFMSHLTIDELHRVADLKCDETVVLRAGTSDEIMVTRQCNEQERAAEYRAMQPTPQP